MTKNKRIFADLLKHNVFFSVPTKYVAQEYLLYYNKAKSNSIETLNQVEL